MTMIATAIATTADLPKLVGYKQLREEYRWPRRTLQEWIKSRKFPKPLDLPGRENYWYLKDVLEWLEERRQGLVARAITNPDQLAPDEVAPTMRMLAVRLIEQEFGEAVRPEHVSLTLSRTPKNDELTSCRAAFLERFEELCGHFSDDRTLFVVASAVPAFRQRCYESGVGDPYLLEDPDRLRRFAIAFLDDEVWAKFEAASKAPADKLALEN